MASSPTPGKVKILAEVADVYGNQVVLHADTMNSHIANGHPEMAGMISEVVETVRDPDRGRASTRHDTSAAWEKEFPHVGPNGTVRVLVGYSSSEYQKGGCLGKVLTAYPNNPRTQSNVTDPIYIKPSK